MNRLYFREGSPYSPDLSKLRGEGRAARALGPLPVQPSQPDQIGTKGFDIRLPGFTFPPAGTIPADPIGDANIAPGGVATLISIPVPDTFRFRASGIGFHTDDDMALGFLTWAILLGPDPAPGYSQQLAAVGSIRQLSSIVVLAASSQTLTVRATIASTAPATFRYACRLQGWFYSYTEGGKG